MAAHAEASDGRGSERWSLKGKTAIVTGGTKGIGKAIVEELASLGASVLTCSRTAADIEARVEEWQNKGYKVFGVMADVSTPAGREALANSGRAKFGGALDILVNNVGMSLRKGTTEYSQEEYANIVDFNFNSVFLLTQLLHPMLKSAAATEGARERGGSSVVNLSSIAGLTALATGAPYAACKGAINRLTVTWGCEWARDGIRVNAVAPGATKTAMTATLSSVPEVEQRITDRIPMGRWGESDDISGLVAFLCMPSSRYVTSQVIAADGGISANGAWTSW